MEFYRWKSLDELPQVIRELDRFRFNNEKYRAELEKYATHDPKISTAGMKSGYVCPSCWYRPPNDETTVCPNCDEKIPANESLSRPGTLSQFTEWLESTEAQKPETEQDTIQPGTMIRYSRFLGQKDHAQLIVGSPYMVAGVHWLPKHQLWGVIERGHVGWVKIFDEKGLVDYSQELHDDITTGVTTLVEKIADWLSFKSANGDLSLLPKAIMDQVTVILVARELGNS
jgi:hypothetical protein